MKEIADPRRPVPSFAPGATSDCQTSFAERLRQARQASGLSQEEAAARIGSTTRSLTRWENAECDPGFGTARQLAQAYGVSLDWLAGRTLVRGVLEGGGVLLDEDVLDTVKVLVDKRMTLRDIPPAMLRGAGLHCAFVIPRRPRLLKPEDAQAVAVEVQALIDRLSRAEREFASTR